MKLLTDPTRPYVSAAATDIRKTFARVRKELKAAGEAKERAEAEAKQKVKPIKAKA